MYAGGIMEFTSNLVKYAANADKSEGPGGGIKIKENEK